MTKSIIFIGFLIAGSYAGADSLSGDTIGAAITNVSSIKSALNTALNPKSQTGYVGFFDRSETDKTICAELGSAVGYISSISDGLFKHTPTFSKETDASTQLGYQVDDVINELTGARNGFCIDNSANRAQVTQQIQRAQELTDRLEATLNSYEH